MNRGDFLMTCHPIPPSSAKGMLKTTAGRVFAAMPKSTSQTSPRLALGTFLLLLIVHEKCGLGRIDQIGFGNDAVRVIVNDSVMAATVLLMYCLLHAPEFLRRKFGKRGLDFQNSAHNKNLQSD